MDEYNQLLTEVRETNSLLEEQNTQIDNIFNTVNNSLTFILIIAILLISFLVCPIIDSAFGRSRK